jgi:alkaline phosphatase D
MNFDRRSVLAILGSGAAVPVPSIGRAQSSTGGRFLHGVASGDPTPAGAIIWTRVTPAEAAASGDLAVEWHVADGPEARPLRSGNSSARSAADHTVKVDVTGLRPGRSYQYWFTLSDGTRSPMGRFRTLPVGRTDRLVLALASCQLFPGGFFNAYADMAKLPELDAVVHLGDYIYEYGATGYGSQIGERIGRLPAPSREILTLQDYRQRHAQYKADPDLQAAHARAAFICVWDDHESANDGWVGGAEEHDPATEGDWKTRKAAAMQAYFEWMPIRNPRPGQPWEAINRSFEFGDLATLAMLETRLLARSKQVMPKGGIPNPAGISAMVAERARPERELLGPVQQQWLAGVLGRSVKARKPWQLLGSQVVMARVDGVDLEQELGPERFAAFREKLPENWRRRIAAAAAGYKAGLPFNLDAWDGYPQARERLYSLFRRAGARPIVFSGDSHAAWANDLYDGQGQIVGNEIGTTAITSPSLGSLMPGIGTILAKVNKEVAFCDQDHKGYALVTLTRETATTQFVAVSTVTDRKFDRSVVASYVTTAGAPAPLRRA